MDNNPKKYLVDIGFVSARYLESAPQMDQTKVLHDNNPLCFEGPIEINTY